MYIIVQPYISEGIAGKIAQVECYFYYYVPHLRCVREVASSRVAGIYLKALGLALIYFNNTCNIIIFPAL